MAITIKEKNRGRVPNVTKTTETLEVKYFVICDAGETDAAARDGFISQLPRTESGNVNILTLQGATIDPEDSALGRYIGTATYTLIDFSTGQQLFTFDTTGGTQKIDYSKATVNSYPSGAPDLKGAINADSNSVAGTDITIPAFGFTATRYEYGTNVTQSHINDLVSITGTVNNATWTPTIDGIMFNFPEGEVLFLGANGSRRGGGDFELNLHCAVSQNATNLTVGGITGIAKKGWEYLWVKTQPQLLGTGTNSVTIHQAQFVYIEKVYDEADLTKTGLH